MNLLKRIKRCLLGKNIPHAHATLVKDGGLNYGYWHDNGWVDENRKVALTEVMGIIDRHVTATEMSLAEALRGTSRVEILDSISANIALETLRRDLLRTLAEMKK